MRANWTGLPAGRYCLISQWSAALGRMRVGIFDPANRTLTWSRATLENGTTYRGFFPIHSSNRLRWAYGGGNLPIKLLSCKWYDCIVNDGDILTQTEEI